MATHRLFGRPNVVLLFVLVVLPLAVVLLVQCSGGGHPAVFVKEPLPYGQDALAPTISAETMGFHYDKHYAGYVEKTNRLIEGTKFAGKSAETVIKMTAGDDSQSDAFNNAAQAWNHAFFFKGLTPDGGGEPREMLAEMIAESFGSFADFKKAFLAAAGDRFGSGWVWLVLDQGRLAVVASANADTPLAHDQTPLFSVDVWEHAYYLDYQNRRTDFVTRVLDELADWDVVAERLAQA
ncbi:MAG: superoxide dismutase, partial [Desulfosarcina sp.]